MSESIEELDEEQAAKYWWKKCGELEAALAAANARADKAEAAVVAVVEVTGSLTEELARLKADNCALESDIKEAYQDRQDYKNEADRLKAKNDHGVCDECETPYSFDPTDKGSICVRCLLRKNDAMEAQVKDLTARLGAANRVVVAAVKYVSEKRKYDPKWGRMTSFQDLFDALAKYALSPGAAEKPKAGEGN